MPNGKTVMLEPSGPIYPHLTADDWGLSPGVNAGILEIARLNRGLRVSAMPNEESFEHLLNELRSLPNVKIGLHYNLTHGFRYRSPGALMAAWMCSTRGDRKALIAWAQDQLRSQLNRFRHYEVPVHYFDSHHHIHLIPGLFDYVKDILLEHGVSEVRIPADSRLLTTAKFPLHFLALRFRSVMRGLNFTTREFFYPQVSDLRDENRLRILFDHNSQKEILIHPGLFDTDSESLAPFDRQRSRELSALRKLFKEKSKAF